MKCNKMENNFHTCIFQGFQDLTDVIVSIKTHQTLNKEKQSTTEKYL